MNTHIIILIIAAFAIAAEILTYVYRNQNKFIYFYIMVIRLLTVGLALVSMNCIAEDHDILYEEYEYNENLLNHYDSLRILQTEMIDSLANHAWNEHNCELPMFDGNLLDNIHEQEATIDSLEQIK